MVYRSIFIHFSHSHGHLFDGVNYPIDTARKESVKDVPKLMTISSIFETISGISLRMDRAQLDKCQFDWEKAGILFLRSKILMVPTSFQ